MSAPRTSVATAVNQLNAKEVVMSHLTLEGDNVTYNPIGLAGDGSVAITLDDTGTLA